MKCISNFVNMRREYGAFFLKWCLLVPLLTLTLILFLDVIGQSNLAALGTLLFSFFYFPITLFMAWKNRFYGTNGLDTSKYIANISKVQNPYAQNKNVMHRYMVFLSLPCYAILGLLFLGLSVTFVAS